MSAGEVWLLQYVRFISWITQALVVTPVNNLLESEIQAPGKKQEIKHGELRCSSKHTATLWRVFLNSLLEEGGNVTTGGESATVLLATAQIKWFCWHQRSLERLLSIMNMEGGCDIEGEVFQVLTPKHFFTHCKPSALPKLSPNVHFLSLLWKSLLRHRVQKSGRECIVWFLLTSYIWCRKLTNGEYYGMGDQDLKCSCRMIAVKFKGTATFLEGENVFIGDQWLPLGGREERVLMTFQIGLVMSLWWAWLPMKKDHLSSASKSLVNGKDFSWLLLLWLVMTMWMGPWDEKDSQNQWNKRPGWPAMSTWGRRGSGSMTANIYHLGLKSATHLQILALSMGFRTLKIHPNFLGTVTNLWDLDVIIFENVAGIGMWSTEPLPPRHTQPFLFHFSSYRTQRS